MNNDSHRRLAGKIRWPAMMAVAALVSANTVPADETAGGESLYVDLGCVYCHGEAGREPALGEYPKLAGQNAAYLVEQARNIRSGARSNRYSAMMRAAVANVTDEQLNAVAAYLSEQAP